MIKIKYGSIFDEKCDLLILPCSSDGSVTRWVKSEIEKYELPFPSYDIPFASVAFLEAGNRYRNANFIAFASSVKANNYSDLESIREIVHRIKNYSLENNITLINLPVLGTGAGGLKHNRVIELYKRELDESSIIFNVYIPDRDIATTFIDSNAIDTIKNPRVFISYAWGNPEVQEWAKSLTNKLCGHGVNARFDKYHLKVGNDMPQWMTDEIIKADKVLLICDEYYAEKANVRKAGVGWETMIVQGDMLTQGSNNKYIAISYGNFDKSIPIYMKSKLAMSKDEVDNNFENLLMNVFELDIAPEIKEIPSWIIDKLGDSKKNFV